MINVVEFPTLWNTTNESLKLLLDGDGNAIDEWCPPLIRADEAQLAPYHLPQKDRYILTEVGMPARFSSLGMYFDCLSEQLARVPKLRPEEIRNGVEFPVLRYNLFIKIGRADKWSECDFCVEEFSGRIFKLTYGKGTYRTVMRDEGGGNRTVYTDHPVLDERNWASTGPYFVSSSVFKLALLINTFRTIYVSQGIKEGLAESHPRRLAGLLRRELKKIDEVAIVRPDSVWFYLLRAIADGIV